MRPPRRVGVVAALIADCGRAQLMDDCGRCDAADGSRAREADCGRDADSGRVLLDDAVDGRAAADSAASSWNRTAGRALIGRAGEPDAACCGVRCSPSPQSGTVTVTPVRRRRAPAAGAELGRPDEYACCASTSRCARLRLIGRAGTFHRCALPLGVWFRIRLTCAASPNAASCATRSCCCGLGAARAANDGRGDWRTRRTNGEWYGESGPGSAEYIAPKKATRRK